MKLFSAVRSKDWRGIVLPVGFLLVWSLLVTSGKVNTRLIVPPQKVAEVGYQYLSNGQLWKGLQASLLRDLGGFIFGGSSGLLLGILLGVSRWAERLIGPAFHTLKQISLFAWIPLISAWMGNGEGAQILFIALSALYPVALNTFEGVRSVTRAHVEVGRVYGFSRWQTLTRLVLPAASPQIMTGLHLSLLYAWLATIGAEYLLGTSGQGIGSVVIRGKAAFNVELILFGMLVIGVVGAVLNKLAARLESRVLHWRGQRS